MHPRGYQVLHWIDEHLYPSFLPAAARRYLPPWFESGWDTFGLGLLLGVSAVLRANLREVFDAVVFWYALNWTLWWWREQRGDHGPDADDPDPDGPGGVALRAQLQVYRRSIFDRTPTPR